MSYHIAILGAGISGLSTAWFLKQLMGPQVRLTILEKQSRVGGWIQTLQTQDFLFEQGPRSCRTKGKGLETLALIEALGLQDQILVPHSHASSRYLYDGKRLQILPKKIWNVLFNPLTKGWLQALWRDWWMPKRQKEDESIQEFFSRRLGNLWTGNLIDPFVLGIYAGDCRRLSLKSCFPLFDQWEQQYGSLLRGSLKHRPLSMDNSTFVRKMGHFPMFSFKEGMEILPLALAHQLKNELFLDKTVHRLSLDPQGVNIELEDGQSLKADHVISTLPTFALSSLLSLYPLLKEKLKKLTYTTVTIVNMGFHQEVLPFKGFGYLVPSKLGLQVLGCVWDSCVFPQQSQQNQTRLTLMLGGSRHPEIEQLTENKLIEYSLQILREQMGICLSPQMIQIKTAKNAIPQFEVGHSLWKKEVQEEMDQLSHDISLSGSAWSGVSINDCIAHARQLAQNLSSSIHVKIPSKNLY